MNWIESPTTEGAKYITPIGTVLAQVYPTPDGFTALYGTLVIGTRMMKEEAKACIERLRSQDLQRAAGGV